MIGRTLKFIFNAWPSLLFGGVIAWIFFIFTPTVIVESKFEISEKAFIFDSYSYKTMFGNILCNKPNFAAIVFRDNAGNIKNVNDNASGFGTGNSNITRWRSTGNIPSGLQPGTVSVRKKLVYPCIFNTARDVFSGYHYFRLK